MVEAAPNPPNQSIADLVGSSRYNAIGDDSLKDEDNAAWVMFLPTEVARDWIEPFSWIRLIDRLAESEWIEGWGSRFQVFRIGWRTLLLTGYVLPDDYHVGLLSQMHARWFRAEGQAPARPRLSNPQRAPALPGGPGPERRSRPPAAGLVVGDLAFAGRGPGPGPGPGHGEGVAMPRRPSTAPRRPILAAPTGSAPASSSSRPGSGAYPTADAGPAWSTVRAWDEYVEATARYTRSDMVFETIDEYEHMLQSLGGSLFQIFPYLTEPQRQAVRAFGAVDQFFNHLRDLPEDTAQNLCYFPADVLERFGVERQEVLDGSCFQNPGYVKMMKFWLGDFVPYLYSQAASFLSDNEMHYSWRLLKHWFLRRHVRLEHAFRRAGMNYKLASQLYFAEVKPGLKRWLRETFAAEGRLDLLAAGPRPLPVMPLPGQSTPPPLLPTSLPSLAALKPSASSDPRFAAPELPQLPQLPQLDVVPAVGLRPSAGPLRPVGIPGLPGSANGGYDGYGSDDSDDGGAIPLPIPFLELSDPSLVTSAAPPSAVRTASRPPGPPELAAGPLGGASRPGSLPSSHSKSPPNGSLKGSLAGSSPGSRPTSRPPAGPAASSELGPPGPAGPRGAPTAFDDDLRELAELAELAELPPEFAEARAYNSGILVLRRRDRGLGAR
ncbi:MAG: squalene/phytoene synthase family protein [Polyangia bacterium]